MTAIGTYARALCAAGTAAVALLAGCANPRLDTGTADVPVTIRLPAGLTLVSASPATVAVTSTIPVPASPAASGSPGASPSG